MSNTSMDNNNATLHDAKYAMINDAIANALTGKGGGNDAAVHNQVGMVMLDYNELINLYRNYWLARKIIDIPVQDMLKNGRNITNLDGDDLKRYLKAWKDLKCDAAMAKGLKFARLVGGSGIIPVNSEMALDRPHNPADFRNGGIDKFIVLDAYELQAAGAMVYDIKSPYFRMPRRFSYQSQTIDITNTILTFGMEQTNAHHLVAGVQIGLFWGLSVFQFGKEPIINAHVAYEETINRLQRDNVDILKVPQLYAAMAVFADNAEVGSINQAITARAMAFARFKSSHNVAILDSTEELERLSYNYAGVTDVLREQVTGVSGMSGIPLTRLAGIAPGGLNNTGDSDLRNYEQSIEGEQTERVQPLYEQLDYYMTLHVFGEAREIEFDINSPTHETEEDKEARVAKHVEWLVKIDALRTVPESVILRHVQQYVMPEIPDASIEKLEAEEKLNDTHGDPDDDDIDPDDPDDNVDPDDPIDDGNGPDDA